MHSGPSIYDEDPNDHFFDDLLNSGWWNPYLEPVREDFIPQFHIVDKEPSGLEL